MGRVSVFEPHQVHTDRREERGLSQGVCKRPQAATLPLEPVSFMPLGVEQGAIG